MKLRAPARGEHSTSVTFPSRGSTTWSSQGRSDNKLLQLLGAGREGNHSEIGQSALSPSEGWPWEGVFIQSLTCWDLSEPRWPGEGSATSSPSNSPVPAKGKTKQTTHNLKHFVKLQPDTRLTGRLNTPNHHQGSRAPVQNRMGMRAASTDLMHDSKILHFLLMESSKYLTLIFSE